MSSFRQIQANRRNAQLSTGPLTEEGKRKSRQNAVRHGTSAIEAGLFNIQARELLSRRRPVYRERPNVVGTIPRNARACEDDERQRLNEHIHNLDDNSAVPLRLDEQSDAVTHCFLQLTGLPTSPLDRLSRYEAALWRQACQIIWTLQCLERRKPWEKRRSSQVF